MIQQKHIAITKLPEEIIKIVLPPFLKPNEVAIVSKAASWLHMANHINTQAITTINHHITSPEEPCPTDTQQHILLYYPFANVPFKEALDTFINHYINTHLSDEKDALFKGLEENTLKDISDRLQEAPILMLARDEDGKTLLHIAVEKENEHIITQLLSAGTVIQTGDNNGITPLDLAVETHCQVHIRSHRLRDTLVAALQNGTDNINAKDSDGNTLLHWAAQEGTIEMVTALVQAGADVTLPNKEGVTALHNAIEGGPDSPDRRNLVAILVNAGAVITDPILKMARETQPNVFNPNPNAFQSSTIYGYLKGVHRNNRAQHNGSTCARSA